MFSKIKRLFGFLSKKEHNVAEEQEKNTTEEPLRYSSLDTYGLDATEAADIPLHLLEKTEEIVGQILDKYGEKPSDVNKDEMGGTAIYYDIGHKKVWLGLNQYLRLTCVVTAYEQDLAFLVSNIDDLRKTFDRDLCGRCVSCFWEERGNLNRMILCPNCRNKRCPKANSHKFKCIWSNAVGQIGEVE